MLPRPPLAVPIAALAALGALAAAVLGDWAFLVGWDAAVSERARAFGHDHPGWVAALRIVTDLGATVPFLAAGLALTAALLRLRRYGTALGVALVTVLAPAAWSCGHTLLDRPRPVGGFVPTISNGFPSGHTTNATALALLGVLLVWSRLGRAGRLVAVAGAVLFAGSVGATRVALLAHWPTDVLGGWLLGAALVPLCLAAGQLISRSPDS